MKSSKLRNNQSRQTATKAAVTQILESFGAPVALSELHRFIKKSLPKTAFSTIYRILRNLETEGKVARIDWRERGSRFEWAGFPHHHHLVCDSCGTITDIDDATLGYDPDSVKAQSGYQLDHHSIELRGRCPDCQAKDQIKRPIPVEQVEP